MVIEPLNLYKIFVNYFAGSITIFFFVAMAFFAYFAAKLKMPNIIFGILMALFILLLKPYFSLLYAITIFIIGLLFYYTLSKLIKT